METEESGRGETEFFGNNALGNYLCYLPFRLVD